MLAQDLHHFVVDDLDHLLRRRKRAEHFLPHRLHLDRLHQLLDDLEVDVGLQQRDANLFERALHVLGSELALAAKVLENALELFGQAIEHLL